MYCFSSSKWASAVPLHKNKNLCKDMYINLLQGFHPTFVHPARLYACFQALTAIKKKKRQTIFTVCRAVFNKVSE